MVRRARISTRRPTRSSRTTGDGSIAAYGDVSPSLERRTAHLARRPTFVPVRAKGPAARSWTSSSCARSRTSPRMGGSRRMCPTRTRCSPGCSRRAATASSGTRSGWRPTWPRSLPRPSGRRASPSARSGRGEDDRSVYEVQEETFADQLDHERLSYDEWRHWTFGQTFDPELLFLAEDGDELAGIVIARPERGGDETLGWISVLGVRRPWRRRGLGRAAPAARLPRAARAAGSRAPASASTAPTRRAPCSSTSAPG